MRGAARSTAPNIVAAPTGVATGVAAIAEESTATSIAPATLATAILATSAPQATAIPTTAPTTAPSSPTVAPAPSATAPIAATEPVAGLRTILTNGIAAGQAGEDGQDLLKKLDEVQQAIAKGDQKKASEQLRDLQKKVEEKAREGKLDAALAEQTLLGIGQIASTYGLTIS
jgi:eukaryotic-like serine/threonine-protein kinase